MSEQNQSTSDTEELVEKYIAIIGQHGHASTEARAFRKEHPNSDALDDIDAAYSSIDEDQRRGWLRACLLTLILLVIVAIGLLGLFNGVTAIETDKQLVKAEGDVRVARSDAAISEAMNEQLLEVLIAPTPETDPGAGQLVPPEHKETEVDAAVNLDKPADEDTTIALRSSDRNTHFSADGKEDVKQVTVKKGEQSAKFKMHIAELTDTRTIVVGSSAGKVDRAAMTVIPQLVSDDAPTPIDLELLRPVTAKDGAIVHLHSTNPNVTFQLDGKQIDSVTVPAGRAAVHFDVIAAKGHGGMMHLLATVEGGTPFLSRAEPTPVPRLGELMGVPPQVIGGSEPIPVTIDIDAPSAAAPPVVVRTDDPTLSFRTSEGDATELRFDPDKPSIEFEIVTKRTNEQQAATFFVEHERESKEISFVISPRPQPRPPFSSIQVPTSPITGGKPFAVTVPLDRPMSEEEVANIKLAADGITFTADEHGDSMLRFVGETMEVTEPRLVHVTAEHDSQAITSTVLLAPVPKPLPRPPVIDKLLLPVDTLTSGEAVSIAIELTEAIQDPAGVEIELKSTNPRVTFRPGDGPITKINLLPADKQLVFEIVAPKVTEVETTSISVHQGDHQQHAALAIVPKNPTTALRIESITLPDDPVLAGEPFVASLRLADDLPDEEIAQISVRANGIVFSRPEMEVGSTTLDFPGTAPEVTLPKLVRVEASFGKDQPSVEATSNLMVIPRSVAKPSLASIAITPPGDGDTKLQGKVELDQPAGDYRLVVFLTSNVSGVSLPEFVIVEPQHKSATFSIAINDGEVSGEVVITASLEDQSRETTLTVEPREAKSPDVENNRSARSSTRDTRCRSTRRGWRRR